MSFVEIAQAGNIDQLKRLIAKGTDVNERDEYGNSAVHKVAQEGPKTVMKFLVANGVDVNARDTQGKTPLHWAVDCVTKEQHKSIKLLLNHKVHINVKDLNGETPLYWANQRGHNVIAKLLQSSGAKE